MEGNIIFRQGERTIFADRMYYDVRNQVGTVLQGKMQGPVPQFEGLLRLRAEVIQQLGPDHFIAHDAFITSSRIGAPGLSPADEHRDHQRPAATVDRPVYRRADHQPGDR